MSMEFSCKDVAESVEKAIYHVIWNHYEVTTEDGEFTWQADPLTLVISNPASPNYKHPKIPYGDKFYEEYIAEIVEGKNAGHFDYDYYSRLQLHEAYPQWVEDFLPCELPSMRTVNQVSYMVDKLKSQPSSRRAVAITWEPWKDTEGDASVPCLQYIQCWFNQGKVDMAITMRSNDVLLALPNNIVGFTNLQMYIAKQLGKRVGKHYYTAILPHIYPSRDKNYLAPWLE